MGIDKKITKSLKLIEQAFNDCESWYIAFSGGKDSTVMRNLILQVNPQIQVVAYVQKWRLPETTEYLKRIQNLNVVCSRDLKDKEYFDQRWKSVYEAKRKWPNCTWLDTDSIACDINYGRPEKGTFIGLRAQESKRREWQIKKCGRLFQKKDGRWQCYPLADWKVEDIWAYIKMQKLDYNKAYDVLNKIGVSRDKQRIAEFEIDSVTGLGTLAILKRGWPGLFNEYKKARPSISAYV